MPKKASWIFALVVPLAVSVPAVFAEDRTETTPVEPAAAVQERNDNREGGFERYMEKHGERLEKEMENVMEPFDKGMEGIQGDGGQEGGAPKPEKK
jgi:hypothetical protein